MIGCLGLRMETRNELNKYKRSGGGRIETLYN